MHAERLALPVAYADPAFMACLKEAIETPELVVEFNRLYEASLGKPLSPIEKMVDKACGKDESDMRGFIEFVHDCIYTPPARRRDSLAARQRARRRAVGLTCPGPPSSSLD